jgi:VanZ family protein
LQRIPEKPSESSDRRGGLPEASSPPLWGQAQARRAYLILLVAYVVFVVYGSIVPCRFHYVPFSKAVAKFRHIPYLTLGSQHRSDLVANFLLFVPLTFLAMGALVAGRRRWAAAPAAVGVAGAAAVFSMLVEFLQVYFPQRTLSQNDILAEAAGGACGAAVWLLFGRRITQWAQGMWIERVSGRLAVKILSGYLVFVVLYNLLPFDLVLSPVEIYRKFKAGMITIVPFTDRIGPSAYTVISKTAAMIPIGFLFALVDKRRRGHSVLMVTLKVLLFGAVVESAQVFVLSRYASATDAIFAAVGGFLGALAAIGVGPVARRPITHTPFWRRWGWCIKVVAACAFTAAIAFEKCRPFEFARPRGGLVAGLSRSLTAPLTSQYYLTEFLAASQVVRELVTFFVLGLLVKGAFSPDKSSRAAWCAVVACMAVGFEFVQVFLPTRTPDLTAAIVSAVGGVAGILTLPAFVNVFINNSNNPRQSPVC